MRGITVFLIVLFASCSKNNGKNNTVACTEEARAGLNVSVIDATTGKYLSDSVTVIASTNSSTQTLTLFGNNPPVFSGAFEQPGTYTLTASRPGFHSYTYSPVTVTKDECHVVSQSVTLTLHR